MPDHAVAVTYPGRPMRTNLQGTIFPVTLVATFCGTDSFYVVHMQKVLAPPQSSMGVETLSD